MPQRSPTLAALDSLLERRLCGSLDVSSGELWTLPSPGLPDAVLRDHVADEKLRALYAFIGSKIFSQTMPPIIAQTFSSYPGDIRRVIEAQVIKSTVLSRISSRLPIYAYKVAPIAPGSSSPKVQLLYATVLALSEHHGSYYAAAWLKTLVGNLVPVIMDTIADWEDLELSDSPLNNHGEVSDLADYEGSSTSVFGVHNDRTEDQSKPEFFGFEDDDPDFLAELLETHLLQLNPLNEDI